MFAQQTPTPDPSWLSAHGSALVSALSVAVSMAAVWVAILAVRQSAKQFQISRQPDVIAWYGYTGEPRYVLDDEGKPKTIHPPLDLVVQNIGQELATDIVLRFDDELVNHSMFNGKNYGAAIKALTKAEGFTLGPGQRYVYHASRINSLHDVSKAPQGSIRLAYRDRNGQAYNTTLEIDLRPLAFAVPRS